MMPTIHSPLALLFSKIKAEMVANGTPFADAAAEIAFRAWLQTAWADSGYTSDFAVLYQPNTSTAFSVGVRVGTAGHKVNVWWGDGGSDSYTPSTSSDTTISHTYGSAAKWPIVMLGRTTRFEASAKDFSGRLNAWLSNLESLQLDALPNARISFHLLRLEMSLLAVTGTPNASGDIAGICASYLIIENCDFTFSSGVWDCTYDLIFLRPLNSGVFTSGMTDALLNALIAATWFGNKRVDLRGNCGAPTAASEDAILVLIDAGVTVLTN